jgi:ATP-dependent RNA helicase DeaD
LLDINPNFVSKLPAHILFPSPIQVAAIKVIKALRKPDVIIDSPSGTGKTLAYLLPALSLIDRLEKGTQVIIVCPSRELCLQLTRIIHPLVKGWI